MGLRLLGKGPLLILVLLVAVIGLLTPNFLKPGNLSNIIAQTAVIAIVAMGQQLVILTRGIDLSVGANLALATVIGGLVFRVVNSAPLAMLAAILLVLTKFMVWGRSIYAVGGNPKAAVEMGIPIEWVLVTYVIAGLCAA